MKKVPIAIALASTLLVIPSQLTSAESAPTDDTVKERIEFRRNHKPNSGSNKPNGGGGSNKPNGGGGFNKPEGGGGSNKPKPDFKPNFPKPDKKPEMPKPDYKPEMPKPDKPEMPKPDKPEIPKPDYKPEAPKPDYNPPKPYEPKPIDHDNDGHWGRPEGKVWCAPLWGWRHPKDCSVYDYPDYHHHVKTVVIFLHHIQKYPIEKPAYCQIPDYLPNGQYVVIDCKAYPVCLEIGSDPDGDSWGWENEQSCKVIYPYCSSNDIDTDGDGWGYENNETCLCKT